MKTNFKIVISLLIAIFLMSIVLLFAILGFDFFSNTIRIGGSTEVYEISLAVAEQFKRFDPNIDFIISKTDTGGGMQKFINGELDIVGATRLPRGEEYITAANNGRNIFVNNIGRDAVAVIVHPSKYEFIKEMDRETVEGIFFQGSITDWSELNDHLSGKIDVYVRSSKESGTAALFNSIVTGSENTPYINESLPIDLTPEVAKKVAVNPNAIAYSPLKWVDNSVRALAYGEFLLKKPTIENIINGNYDMTRNMYMITDGIPRGKIAEFINFILSDEGQKIVEEAGFIKK